MTLSSVLDATLGGGRAAVVEKIRRQSGTRHGAYVSGSIVAGYGNTRSNVNVYIVTDADSTQGFPEADLSRPGFDVELVSIDEIEHWIEFFAKGRIEAGDIDRIVTAKKVLEPFSRFWLSTLVGPSDKLVRLSDSARSQTDSLRRTGITWHSVQAANTLTDLIGAIEAEDPATAGYLGVRLLYLALQGFLAGSEQHYVGEKWTWAKLRRTRLPAEIRERIEDLVLHAHGRGDRKPLHVERINWAQSLLAAANVRGWHTGDADLWTEWPLPETELERSIHWSPVRYFSKIHLNSVDYKSVKLSEQGLALWGGANGHSFRSGVISGISKRYDAAPSVVDDYLTKLIDRGLLV